MYLACLGRWLRRAQSRKAGCHDRITGRGLGRNDLGGTGGAQRVRVQFVRSPGDHRDVRGCRPNHTDGGFGGPRVVNIHDHQAGLPAAEFLQHLLLRNVSEDGPVAGGAGRAHLVRVPVNRDIGKPAPRTARQTRWPVRP